MPFSWSGDENTPSISDRTTPLMLRLPCGREATIETVQLRTYTCHSRRACLYWSLLGCSMRKSRFGREAVVPALLLKDAPVLGQQGVEHNILQGRPSRMQRLQGAGQKWQVLPSTTC